MFRNITRSAIGISQLRVKSCLALITTPSSAIRNYSSKFTTEFTPGPPRLPDDEQQEFEKLQKIANSQIAIEEYNEQIAKDSAEGKNPQAEPIPNGTDIGSFSYFKTVPEFEGDVNPVTGERGGPKQDPLKHPNEWAFNGRVTDF